MARSMQGAGGGIEGDAGKIEVTLVRIVGFIRQADVHRMFAILGLLGGFGFLAPDLAANPAH